MRRNKQNNPGLAPGDAGDMRHTLAALRSHCHGTGRAHPLWAPAAGQA
ncbi:MULTISPECIES: hypothetical protein [Streptomyces]|nr:hypothetical protein [Streptomyces virginiae]